MFFPGPATRAQFENLLIWRKRARPRATAGPDLPDPRRDNDEAVPEAADLYALSVGRVSVR
jgi:hypothetical protein